MNRNNDNPFGDIPVIHRYTRAQAIDDGVLIDLTEWARETGFTIPVACTAAVWNQYITPPTSTESLGQCERGRGHDVLWMLYNAIRRRRTDSGDQDRLVFEVLFLQKPHRHETVKLKTICGPGDAGEPVLTIMLPDED